jgi:predicted glycogen debranching enzyme
LTFGLGGFATSTVVGCNTRRYHGLLCAATLPPVGRIMLLNRMAEVVKIGDESFDLSINQFGDTFHPRGDRHLRRFSLGQTAMWQYELQGITVTRELLLLWGRNAVAIRYSIHPKHAGDVQLEIAPFVSLRDFHSLRHAGDSLVADNSPAGVKIHDTQSAATVSLHANAGTFIPAPDWWRDHFYAIEAERGLDRTEDLFTPGRFVLNAADKSSLTIVAAIEGMLTVNWDNQVHRRETAYKAAVVQPLNDGMPMPVADASPVIQRLTHAAADFIVQRKMPGGGDGETVVAGYPWFADWGRDTMISLPGLLLTTRRFGQARKVLNVFASYVSQGMIPNRFDDYTNEPLYNTVDASLWFIHACFEYLRLSKDQDTFQMSLKPACEQIIEGYSRGTRYGIVMDDSDGLITQGDASTQLTWMDAKCGDIAFTPRQGKPVEINALWYHALRLMGHNELADKVRDSFVKAFWLNPFRGLADVVDSDRRDTAIRPNQIFAVSLANSPLSHEQQSAVVEVVRRELLTPFGLRTLARSDPNYHPSYIGTQFQRDGAYHNGTIWPWPLGAFLDGYLRVNKRSVDSIKQARQWLTPLIEGMEHTACIGQISEIYEAAEPHRPVGCFAQAWSIAEVLRLAVELGM